jgi:hypothetical protein
VGTCTSSPSGDDKPPFRTINNCVPVFLRNSFYSDTRHFPLCLFTPRESPALPCRRESPSHPPGAKDHVSGILDSSAERKSGEVVAENWNSVPHGRWSLLDRRACETSVQRLISAVRHSQQVSRVNAAIEGPRRKRSSEKRKTKRTGKTSRRVSRQNSRLGNGKIKYSMKIAMDGGQCGTTAAWLVTARWIADSRCV